MVVKLRWAVVVLSICSVVIGSVVKIVGRPVVEVVSLASSTCHVNTNPSSESYKSVENMILTVFPTLT